MQQNKYYSPLLSSPAEDALGGLTQFVIRAINLEREWWLMARIAVRIESVPGAPDLDKLRPEEFFQWLKSQGIRIERRVILPKRREELWINGKLDSTFEIANSLTPTITVI